jgi:N-glycosylase/DNA lyase
VAAVTPSPKKNKRQQQTTTRKRKNPPGNNNARRVLPMEEATMTLADISYSSPTMKTTTTPTKTSAMDTVLTSDLIATINPHQPFIDLKIPPEELRPSATLTTGQCFHWRAVQQSRNDDSDDDDDDDSDSDQNLDVKNPSPSTPLPSSSAWGSHDAQEWVGTVRLPPPHDDQSVVLVVRETPTTTLYRPLTDITLETIDGTVESSHEVLHDFLRRHYFQICCHCDDDDDDDDDETNRTLKDLYTEWSEACPRMKIIASCLPGVRVLQQDPWECLVSFICSSNNNIPRITQMVERLRRQYGNPILTIASSSSSPSSPNNKDEIDEPPITFYSFPSLKDMISAGVTEDDLRTKCGMGYRAKYILGTMKLLGEKGGEVYLHNSLGIDEMEEQYDDRHLALRDKLCEFPGVGRKVADCVALFSLRGDSCIPVDTHVWNIARRDYATNGHDNDVDDDHVGTSRNIVLSSTVKSITPAVYQAVGDLFRQRFPNKSGWAHSLLFVAELPSFRPVLPTKLIEEMDGFRKEEQSRKKDQKEQQQANKPKKIKVKNKK